MYLRDLITFLEEEDPTRILPVGFKRPHSYRGDYSELAFQPALNVSVKDMLEDAKSALGREFTGYKGGEYKMHEYTECYLAHYGRTGGLISPILLAFMLGKTQDEIAEIAMRTDWLL